LSLILWSRKLEIVQHRHEKLYRNFGNLYVLDETPEDPLDEQYCEQLREAIANARDRNLEKRYDKKDEKCLEDINLYASKEAFISRKDKRKLVSIDGANRTKRRLNTKKESRKRSLTLELIQEDIKPLPTNDKQQSLKELTFLEEKVSESSNNSRNDDNWHKDSMELKQLSKTLLKNRGNNDIELVCKKQNELPIVHTISLEKKREDLGNENNRSRYNPIIIIDEDSKEEEEDSDILKKATSKRVETNDYEGTKATIDYKGQMSKKSYFPEKLHAPKSNRASSRNDSDCYVNDKNRKEKQEEANFDHLHSPNERLKRSKISSIDFDKASIKNDLMVFSMEITSDTTLTKSHPSTKSSTWNQIISSDRKLHSSKKKESNSHLRLEKRLSQQKIPEITEFLPNTDIRTSLIPRNQTSRSRSQYRSPIVSFSGFRDNEEKQFNEAFQEDLADRVVVLGGELRFGEMPDLKTTHVIAPPSNRTLKTLAVALTGHWIVSPQWILDSTDAGYFVDESPYGQRLLLNPFLGKKIYFTEEFLAESKGKPFKDAHYKYLIVQCAKGQTTNIVSEADFVLIPSVIDRRKLQTSYSSTATTLTAHDFFELIQTVNCNATDND